MWFDFFFFGDYVGVVLLIFMIDMLFSVGVAVLWWWVLVFGGDGLLFLFFLGIVFFDFSFWFFIFCLGYSVGFWLWWLVVGFEEFVCFVFICFVGVVVCVLSLFLWV